jgi:hypothetical protein
MARIDREAEIYDAQIKDAQTRIDAVCDEGQSLADELSRSITPTFWSNLLDDKRLKSGVQDLTSSLRELHQIANLKLEPEDGARLQRLSSALHAGRLDDLHAAKTGLQEAVKHLSAVKEPSQKASAVEWIEYRDAKRRLETLSAAAEVARTAEIAVRGELRARDALLKVVDARPEPPSRLRMLGKEWMTKAQEQLGSTNAKMYMDETEVRGDPKYGTDATGFPTYDGKRLEWCGAFVTWALHKAGIVDLPDKPSEVKQWSTEWPKNGQGKVTPRPVLGAVAVFGPQEKPEHVGLVAGRLANGRIVVLGGNQARFNDSSGFRGVTYNVDSRDAEYFIPKGDEPKAADYELPLMYEKNGTLVYVSDEIEQIRSLPPQEALERLVDLIGKSGIDQKALKADYERIWLEAGGEGEPPRLP